VAALADLAACKLAVLPQRAEAKDYLDVAAILRHGMTLEHALGCAQAVYGEQFNPMFCLKALCYFADGDLPTLPVDVRKLLADAASTVTTIPNVPPAGRKIAA
jgi:hypothetical protein